MSAGGLIVQLLLLLVAGALCISPSNSKWIVSLMPTASEQDMELVKQWIVSHNYKVTESISEYQLRVFFVEADSGIGNKH